MIDVGNKDKRSRTEKVRDSALDTVEKEVEIIINQLIKEFINNGYKGIREWIENWYKKRNVSSDNKEIEIQRQQALKALDKQIADAKRLEEAVRGEREARFIWAMRKISISEEEIQQVLDLVNGKS